MNHHEHTTPGARANPQQAPQAASVTHQSVLRGFLPDQLKNLRDRRYRGEDFDVALEDLAAEDQAHVRLLYAFVKDLYLQWGAMRDAPNWLALRKSVSAVVSPPLSVSAKALGLQTVVQCADPVAAQALGKVFHDLRGGALLPLQLYARMAEWDDDTAHLRSAAFLARDQAKIMRNVLPALDPAFRMADEAEKPHFMQAVVEKWDQFQFECSDTCSLGRVQVNCEYDGLLASCCLEASAVDRVIYNYVNNAIRFTHVPAIDLEIVPVCDHAARWIVANRLSPDQARWLETQTHGDLSKLFRGGLSRGGNGLGLSNCADFVAAAFGLPSADAALEGQYLGAMVEDGWFRAWAHWPALYSQ